MQITGTEKTLETILAEPHRSAGAKMGVWFGCSLPDDFGDSKLEYSFGTKSVGLVDGGYRAYVSLIGPDRVRYLNAVLTNNVKDLGPGRGVISLLLNPQGRILAELEVYALNQELLCVSYAMARERLVETLDKFIIMDDVTLRDDSERYVTFSAVGPAAAQLVTEQTGLDLHGMTEMEMQSTHIGRSQVSVIRKSVGKVPAADFMLDRSAAAPVWETLSGAARRRGGGPMGYTAWSALRLEHGIPWFGYDFGEKQIPHEAGLQDSHISYSKGCYTGQEIVERVRSRGQVNRQRALLAFGGPNLPTLEEPLTVSGAQVGYVTSAAAPPSLPFGIGMGYVRKENRAVGSVLDWSGGTARVAMLPWLAKP
jgi:folate-binding protein YgfZ